MPEKRKSSLLLTLGTAGLLVSGGVAAYWFLLQRNGEPGDLPVGANIIPQDALIALSVSTDNGQWQQLRQYGTQQTQAELEKNLAQLRDRFLTANGYNYQQDIQPWVGKEVTIALLPPSQLRTNAPQQPTSQPNSLANAADRQSIVMVLPIENPASAKQLLEQPKPLKQGSWSERNYKGLEIRETQGSPTQNYSAALVDQRFLVVTDNPRATEKAIDTYKEGTGSLAQTVGYTKALGQIATPGRFAQVYVNVPAAAKVAAANPSSFSPQGLAQLQNNQGLAATVNLEPEGMRMKSISWLKPDSQRVYQVENKAGSMQSLLPGETLMMLSGGNLQRLWQDYVQDTQSNPLAPLRPDELRGGVKSTTGLNLDRDLLSWMGGEFALSVIPSAATGDSKDFALSLLFMVKANNRNQAEQSFEQLDRVMRSRYQFQIQETKVKDQPVVNWVAPYGTVTATHGWLEGDVAFLALGAPVASRIIPKPTTTLASTGQFQKTVPSELNPTNGQFFLNVEHGVKALPLPQFFSNQKMLFDATRSIGVTSAVSDDRSIRYDLFFALKQVGK
jgi:hypothetical protein